MRLRHRDSLGSSPERVMRNLVQFGRTKWTILAAGVLMAFAGDRASAQQKKPSPDAYAATQVGGRYEGADQDYIGGKWIEISYGGPIRRGRDLWGAGSAYGKMLNAGAPVWRAGADVST